MKILLPKDPGERKPLLFTFEGDLDVGEAITLVTIDTVQVHAGVDPTPGAILDTAPLLLPQARQVLQWVSGGLADVDYGIRCFVTGAKGGVHIASCRLPVRRL